MMNILSRLEEFSCGVQIVFRLVEDMTDLVHHLTALQLAVSSVSLFPALANPTILLKSLHGAHLFCPEKNLEINYPSPACSALRARQHHI